VISLALDVVRCDPSHRDAGELLDRLANRLGSVRGESDLRPFEYGSVRRGRGAFILVRQGTDLVGCGALIDVNSNVGEVRQVYAEPGYGRAVIANLERIAWEAFITRIVLATRKCNTRALKFYLRSGFTASQPYGPYQTDRDAVCFEKRKR
jgi:N-acetylglutamate synthase-like GNAT family acetyltransferase